MGLGGKSVFTAPHNEDKNAQKCDENNATNKTLVNEKFQKVLKTLASNLKESKENVQDKSNQGQKQESGKTNGKDKNPLLPLLDQEKHFFELTKHLMQPSTLTHITAFPLEKLDLAYRSLNEILFNGNYKTRVNDEVTQ